MVQISSSVNANLARFSWHSLINIAGAVHWDGINQVDSVINRRSNRALRIVPLSATPHPSSNRPSSKPTTEASIPDSPNDLYFIVFLINHPVESCNRDNTDIAGLPDDASAIALAKAEAFRVSNDGRSRIAPTHRRER